ncbi:hypothetical protein [Cupriavidus sp. H18C2]|uniref:hypothetical protein n=1 Tax=Cupriavidus sp. H18C2 TaxID=3241602 RepID=UPI003BF861C5
MSSKPRTGGDAKPTDTPTNPGVRTDRRADEVKSRSADPGQSSYGGFRNEDPGAQHQADSGAAEPSRGKDAGGESGKSGKSGKQGAGRP